jgi:hypothetical protein
MFTFADGDVVRLRKNGTVYVRRAEQWWAVNAPRDQTPLSAYDDGWFKARLDDATASWVINGEA